MLNHANFSPAARSSALINSQGAATGENNKKPGNKGPTAHEDTSASSWGKREKRKPGTGLEAGGEEQITRSGANGGSRTIGGFRKRVSC